MFGNDNRIKGTVSVPRHLNLYGIIVLGYNSFCCITVPAVSGIITCIVIFFYSLDVLPFQLLRLVNRNGLSIV